MVIQVKLENFAFLIFLTRFNCKFFSGNTVLSPNLEVTLIETGHDGNPVFKSLAKREVENLIPVNEKQDRIFSERSEEIKMDYRTIFILDC
jgi:hypothetical protein